MAIREASPPAGRLTNILAVVVTYHPDAGLERNLAALRAQLETVVVIDNASPASFEVERKARDASCRFIANADNLGMPAALNQAAAIALAEGFEWLACFDQDSLVPPGAFAGLMEVVRDHPQRERIGIVSMSHRDRVSGKGYHSDWHTLAEGADWRSLRTTISSGHLARTEALKEFGLFDGRLFMDWFDHDLCLRFRGHGLLVIEGKQQIMEHSIGEVRILRVLGMNRAYSVHSPLRNYYFTRDTLKICLRHLRTDPRYCLWAISAMMILAPFKVLRGPERRKRAAATLAGVCDFVLGRSGPRGRS